MEGPLTGFIRFAAFSAALIALLVFVVIPLVAGPVISGLVRDAGVLGDDVDVSVNVLGPGILSGHVPSLRLQADDVEVPRAAIGRLDITLSDVSAVDRSFQSISGMLREVRVTGPGGLPLVVAAIDLDGPTEATRATGRLDRSQSQALVRAMAGQAGVTVDDVRLREGSLTFRHGGEAVEAELVVVGEALVLETAGADPVVLLAPATPDPWRLRDVRITPDGMMVDLTVDLRGMAAQVIGPAP